ncbi:MAG: carboxy terminal-processing peptidase [Pseudomonadales bacterium]|nr:carboxy terminal-processing peptidase [Pseudomonadales bacterium]
MMNISQNSMGFTKSSLKRIKAPLLAFALIITTSTYLSNASAIVVVKENSVEKLVPDANHVNTTRNIVDALASRHYVNTTLDDDLSKKIYEGYLSDLDPSRSYFLASDIEKFNQYTFTLDDALKKGDVSAAYEIFNVYHQRVISRFEKVTAQIEASIADFDFTKDEELVLDRSEHPWAINQAELDDIWRKRIKNDILNLRMTDKESDKIQELLVKRYKNRLSSTRQTNTEDVFQLYMNAFTATYDPHTQYFSPRTSENFNINMSLSLEGIGAVLRKEDEYTKVLSLVPKGPADNSKNLFPDDKIIAVGQGSSGEMVDVIGWRLDEVVQLIRGKKDTIVRLDVISAKKKEAGSEVVLIKRQTVKLEEQSAKSEIIEVKQFGATRKIGVIHIPTFYIDFKALSQGDKEYKSTTRDVKKLLLGLMEDGVDGIVVDLRNNGGGSLQEAKTLTGLFIDNGPTVQIRNKSNRVDILYDKDKRTVFDGPLVVMVNRLSASASEIFAGAIQDYERGVIIGSQTFGKGTVQTLLPLNAGQLKLTAAKFYRISGESTQHRGIIPDIHFPKNFDPETIGESTLDEPLPWDKIRTAGYRTKHSIALLLSDLQSMHNERAMKDPDFQYIENAFAYRQERAKIKSVTLNEQKRKDNKIESDNFWLGLENKKRSAQGLELLKSLDELIEKAEEVTVVPATGIPAATDDEETPNIASLTNPVSGTVDEAIETAEITPEDQPELDAFLLEAGQIVLDMSRMAKRTVSKKGIQQNI